MFLSESVKKGIVYAAVTACAVSITIILSVFLIREVPKFAHWSSYWVWEKTKCGECSVFLNPRSAKLHFDIGNYFFGGGAYDIRKAEAHFRSAIALDNALPGTHYQLSRIYFIRGDLWEALTEISKELELHPDNQRSYYIRGLVYGYGGLLPEAEADFKKFLEWKPESWAGHNDLAWIYFQKGEYENVEKTAREGLKYDAANVWLLNSLGVALLNLEQKEEAEAVFQKALAILSSMNPEDWGKAYPGNDPQHYKTGFEQMKASIEANLNLLEDVDS